MPAAAITLNLLPITALGVACSVIYANRAYTPLQIPLFTTPATTLAIGATARLLGPPPKTAMAFAATVSIIYYMIEPYFRIFQPHPAFSHAAFLGLTKVATDMLNLKLPLSGQFAKAYLLTMLFRAFFDTVQCTWIAIKSATRQQASL